MRDDDEDDEDDEKEESSSPNVISVKGHNFKKAYFKTLTWCFHCRCLIRGVLQKQGHKCKVWISFIRY
jgi:hypothetical protein